MLAMLGQERYINYMRPITEKQLNTIKAYMITVDPITGIGNMLQACKTDKTLSLTNAYGLQKRDDWLDLLEFARLEEYKKGLKITELTKEDLIRKVEIAVSGFEEYLNPLTGSLELKAITPQLKQKARVELAELHKWKDKTVNHKHDITDFLNKVVSKGFTMPTTKRIDDVIDVKKL